MTQAHAPIPEPHTDKKPALAEIRLPGVLIKLYETISKEEKAAVYGRFARRRKVGDGWEENPWINSLSDLDHIIEACVLAKRRMRDFYRQRDALLPPFAAARSE